MRSGKQIAVGEDVFRRVRIRCSETGVSLKRFTEAALEAALGGSVAVDPDEWAKQISEGVPRMVLSEPEKKEDLK